MVDMKEKHKSNIEKHVYSNCIQ